MKFLRSKSSELLDFIPDWLKADYWVFVIKRRSWPKWLCLVLFLFLFAGVASSGFGWWYMFKYDGCFFNLGCLTDDDGEPLDLEKLARSEFKKASYIYANNEEEIGKYFDEIRDPVRLDEITTTKRLQDAFLAAEDKRFYKHPGIDMIAITSAFVGNTTRELGFTFWTRSGGASTITQQLARLSFTDEVSDFKNRAHTLRRKLKEARLAIRLEKRYSKKEIFQTYLNLIWLGHGANGIVAGARRYWGKDIRKEQPTIREAVILASINKFPVLYDPIFRKPLEPKIENSIPAEVVARLQEEYQAQLIKEAVRLAVAKDRYNFVLEQMRNNRFITQKEYEENLFQKDNNPSTEELAHLHPWKNPDYGYSNRLIKVLMMGMGYTDKELVHRGGLRIYTTIDSALQQIAQEEFEKQLADVNKEKGPGDQINGALIIINTKGEIKALIGGRDFEESEFDRVFAYRSPGSGIKPFIYAAAIDKFGFDLFTKTCNTSFSMRGGNGKQWAPKNFRDRNPRPSDCNRDLFEGVKYSLNLVTLNVAIRIGMPPIMDLFRDFGIRGSRGMVIDSDGNTWLEMEIPPNQTRGELVPLLPTAIGASDVNLLEVANGYTVFFRGGTYVRPTLIKKVTNTFGDQVIYQPTPAVEKRVVSEDTAAKVVAMMREVARDGTSKISMRGIEQPIACKTGTSNGPRDVSIWCGTPEMFIGVRLGYDDNRIIELPEYMTRVSHDPSMEVTGGWVAAKIPRKIVDRYYKDRAKVPFSPKVEEQYQRIQDRINPESGKVNPESPQVPQ